MARRHWVNFQCRGVLLIWIMVGQGPTVLAVGAGGGCLDIFSLVYQFSLLSPSLWETARYRLKYCLKGPLSPKQLNSTHENCPVSQSNSLETLASALEMMSLRPQLKAAKVLISFLRLHNFFSHWLLESCLE